METLRDREMISYLKTSRVSLQIIIDILKKSTRFVIMKSFIRVVTIRMKITEIGASAEICMGSVLIYK